MPWSRRDTEFLAYCIDRRNRSLNVSYLEDDYDAEDDVLGYPVVWTITGPAKAKSEKAKSEKAKQRSLVTKKLKSLLERMRGNLCESCHKVKYDHVNHRDLNPANNELDNLELLCYKCHLAYHKARRKH